jgi:hypothetical protein
MGSSSISCSKAKGSHLAASPGCIGEWLGAFVGAIPLPGFSVLGKVAEAAATTVTGVLKDAGKDAIKGTCDSASSFSEQQMQQMRQAITEAFDEQNHKAAVAAMDKLGLEVDQFNPDVDEFKSYSMNPLQTMINEYLGWYSTYDNSPSRIYNIKDYIIVSGYAMYAYQHQVREVALEAASKSTAPTKSDAEQVRNYAKTARDEANRAIHEIDTVLNNDAENTAKSFWQDGGLKVNKIYSWGDATYYFCTLSKKGHGYNNIYEPGPQRLASFIDRVHNTTTFQELSDLVQNDGSFCCTGGDSCNQAEEKVEGLMASAIAEVTKQVRVVMYNNEVDIVKFHDETLPTVAKAAQAIIDADDNTIFSLAGNASSGASSSNESAQGGDGNSKQGDASNGGDSAAANGKPYCKTAGYGDAFDCGSGLTCKKDDQSLSDASICVLASSNSSEIETAANGKPYCKSAGYGDSFDCGSGLTCKKDDQSLSDASICVLK